ncbi:hypothetical protein EIN_498460 [Entamoeba invadens IP1]|uniref:MIF4G domain-containing protein n=1 Tax=Entamoeba invadens IP1 TaxID=370355 RepID=A0A0A1UDL0_ENTIV|nr:hypothetical protein EIN_498460 [Entamoeba invadens IP1]ELP94646.1 hypothetical protein EIN_498460 [Entamoeba invadens IP1]|eukprot:XP_004261417.1 hypothetical protein EIN_498460 [Entamoeba invadens IP1]
MTLCCKLPLYIDKIDVKAEVSCITQTARTKIQITLRSMYSSEQHMAQVKDFAFVVIVPTLNGIVSSIEMTYLEKCCLKPSCYATRSKNVKGLSRTHLELIKEKNAKHLTPGFIFAGIIPVYDTYSNILLTYTIDHALIHIPSNTVTLYSLGKDLFKDARSLEISMDIESKNTVGNIKSTLPMMFSYSTTKTNAIIKTKLEKFKISSNSDLELLKKKDMNMYILTDTSGDFISRYSNGLFFQMNINKNLSLYQEKYLSIVVDLTLDKEELQWCKAYLIGLLILCETRNSLCGFNVYTIQSTTTSFELFQLDSKYFKSPTHDDYKNAVHFIEGLVPSETKSITDVVITQFTPFTETTDVVLATQSRSTKLYAGEKFSTHYLFSGELINLYSAWNLNGKHTYFDMVGPNRLNDMERGIWGLYFAMIAQRLALVKLDVEYESLEETLDVLDVGQTENIPSYTYTDGDTLKLFFPTTKKIKTPLKVHAVFRNEEFGTEVIEDKFIQVEIEHENEEQSFVLEFNQLYALNSTELFNRTTENRVASAYSILDASPIVSCYYSNLQTKPFTFKTPIAELNMIPTHTPLDCPVVEPGDYEPDDKIKHFITSTLNKLSDMTFAGVVTDLLTIDYSNGCVISYLAKTIVNRASRDIKYIPAYADLCVSLSLFISANFTQLLLNILNVEFNVRNTTETDLVAKAEALSPEVIQRILSQSQIRFSAIIKFIGHLNLRGFFPSHFIVKIIRQLLDDYVDQSFEYLILLLHIIGSVWDSSNDLSFLMDEAFGTIESVLQTPQGVSNKVRFLLMDLVDERENRWVKKQGKAPSVAKPGESFDPSLQTIDEDEMSPEKESSALND